MNPFLDNIRDFLSRLSSGQKAMLGLVVAGSIVALSSLVYLNSQPSYALLFGNLQPDDANLIVEALREEGVGFDLKDQGSSIYVPRERVHELRLRFASEGLASDGIQGYELFDGSTIGMTDFMQKVNLKRATEGELARTIANLRQVEMARVHLVLPERSPFRETQIDPSASVQLKLSRGAQLSSAQVEAIVALVGGAVEGLSPSQVTVLDMQSNLLSNPDAGSEETQVTSAQLRFQRDKETYLAGKAQSMLDAVLGDANAIVRVSVELDFSRGFTQRSIIDPESATVRSEERQESDFQGDEESASVRNYELNETVERIEKSVGDIAYLTVSVILNQKILPVLGDDADAQPQTEEYTADELTEIEAIVKNAVGFNVQRGDQFAISQTQFDRTVNATQAAEWRQQEQQEQMNLYIRYGFMAVALLLALWLIRNMTKSVQTITAESEQGQLAAGMAGGDGAMYDGDMRLLTSGTGGEGDELGEVTADDYYQSKLSKDAKRRLKAKHLMFDEIRQSVMQNPEQAADMIRTWMSEENFNLMDRYGRN
ncbi:MAG: flagellar basal-body MS-ring/collar protein FliF [Rhodothermales bacterium]